MASDYASKMWERGRKGWAIRNIKLRFSRKLILVWGLLASFSWKLFPGDVRPEDLPEEAWLRLLAAHVREQTDIRPLDMLGKALLQVNDEVLARKILDSYDAFIAFLSDGTRRAELAALLFEEASQSAEFQRLRALSHDFREGINELFFEKHEKLAPLIRRYGVF